jgi:hypothetical protein
MEEQKFYFKKRTDFDNYYNDLIQVNNVNNHN